LDPLSLAATGVSVLGSLFGGIFGNNADQQQAQEYRARATQEGEEGGVNADIAFRQGQATAASAAVQAAANGGGLGGSSMGVIQQASNMAYFNARDQAYRGATAAENDRYNAEVASANGTNALIGGVVGAVGGAVGGALNDQYRKQIQNSLGQLRGSAGSSSSSSSTSAGYGDYGDSSSMDGIS
jgi:hypothetical protein